MIKYSNFSHNITSSFKYPVLTNKALELIGDNRYTFLVNPSLNKLAIKEIIEKLFDVKITKVNTSNLPKKQKRIGKYNGWKSIYKKAIVTVADGYVINIFV